MKLLVTGAGGFLGGFVLAEAASRGFAVRALVRKPVSSGPLCSSVEWLTCDLAALPQDLSPLLEGIGGVIHCAAATSAEAGGPGAEEASRRVNVDAVKLLFEGARLAGVPRWIQISTMSAHPASSSIYGRTKLEADSFLRAASPPPQWTILRPSLIYGPSDKGLAAKTIALARKLPFLPVVGSGKELLRPVFARDAARASLDVLSNVKTFGKTYMLGGGDETSLAEFLRRLLAANGLYRPILRLPLGPAAILARILATCVKRPPLTVDNVKGIAELVPVDHREAVRDWGWAPLGLDEGLHKAYCHESNNLEREAGDNASQGGIRDGNNKNADRG